MPTRRRVDHLLRETLTTGTLLLLGKGSSTKRVDLMVVVMVVDI